MNNVANNKVNIIRVEFPKELKYLKEFCVGKNVFVNLKYRCRKSSEVQGRHLLKWYPCSNLFISV